MKIEVDAQGIPYDQYWLVREGTPIQLAEHFKLMDFTPKTVRLDVERYGSPWIFALPKGLLESYMMYAVGANVFASKEGAVAARRQYLELQLQGFQLQQARVEQQLKELRRFAHVRGKDDCCDYEDRDMNGGCRTCGDPCL